MTWDRIELKARGLSNFRRNYGQAVLVALISAFALIKYTTHFRNKDIFWNFDIGQNFLHRYITGGSVAGVLWLLVDIFILQIILVGAARFYVENRDYDASVSKVLFGFQNGLYSNMVLVMFLKNLFTALWTLLLVVPGIIKSYEYRMIPYILAEQPDISYKDAFRISKEMMYGQKLDAFVLDLSFLGWNILSLFTCGILNILYVAPYMYSTNAELYVVLRDGWFRENNEHDNAQGYTN